MDNKKLKIHLQKLGNSIIFQILEQKVAYVSESIKINNIQIYIQTIAEPDISIMKGGRFLGVNNIVYNNILQINIYLRGDITKHNYIPRVITFQTKEDRDKFYNLLIKSFKMI